VYAGGVVLAEVVRSGFVEGRHHGSVAVLDGDGSLASSAGDPYGAIFPRSSNKPMQATAMLRAGLRLPDPADLALVSASHRGEPFHIQRVRAMLRLGGLTEDDLRCPPDLSIHEPSRHELVRAGIAPARVYMNCSGKHTGMLLTCLSAGWSLVDYTDPDHPLQKGCRTAIEDLAGETVGAVGVDGCGAPVMAISLVGLARAFLNCVSAESGTPERTVADAMRTYPEMMSGTEADDAVLMRGVPGLLSKGGAEGVLAVAIPGAGAVALKIDDGAMRARMPVLVEALRRLGVESAFLDELKETPVLGGGAAVGGVRCVWDESR
jgi:L-asparaginase II